MVGPKIAHPKTRPNRPSGLGFQRSAVFSGFDFASEVDFGGASASRPNSELQQRNIAQIHP